MNCPLTFRLEIKAARRLARAWRLLAILSLALPNLAAAAPYELGQGYRLPLLGLTAGGYASALFTDLKGQKTQATVQDLSLFLHADPSPDWHFFSEIEISNPVTITNGDLDNRDSDFDFERLYVDHNLTPRHTLRFGKFLTPVGRWNTIHADPLVWSASRPLTTSAAFARNASGMMFQGSMPLRSSNLDYQVYLDDSGDLDPSEGHEQTFMDLDVTPNPPSEFRHGAGIHVKYRSFSFVDAWSVGLSAAHFKLKDMAGYKDLVGADFYYEHGDTELTGEAIYRSDDNPAGSSEYGWFLQWVAPIRNGYYGVVTHERYKAEIYGDPVNWTGLGITYRPTPPIAIKIERRVSSGETRLAPSGWLLSAAIMF